MPVQTAKNPLTKPPNTPSASANGSASEYGKAKDLHHAAEGNRDQASQTADGKIHLPDGEGDHLRVRNEDADADAAQQYVEIEFRQEIRRDDRQNHRAQHDRREQARPLGIEDAAHRSGPPHPGAQRQSAAIALDQHRRQQEQPEEEVEPEIANAHHE